MNVHLEDVLLDIQARDERDRSRATAPLLPRPTPTSSTPAK
jgi:cytidylate kinase